MSALMQQKWFIDHNGHSATDPAPIRSILVATDFSSEAGRAVDRAAELCARLGAAATLLNVDNSSPVPERKRRFAPLQQKPTPSASRTLSLLASELTAAHGIEVQAETRRGDVRGEILLMSETSDLLAVASKRRNPLHRLMFRSVSGQLVDRCNSPMLVVNRVPLGPYRRVLVLTDFSAGSIAAARLAARIAPEAEIHLFHAIDLRDETEMRLAEVPRWVIQKQRSSRRAAAQIRMDEALESFSASSSHCAHSFGHGKVVPLALLKRHTLDCDLLVVARGASAIARSVFLSSIARRLSDDCPCDVLVVPTRPDNLAGRRSTESTHRSQRSVSTTTRQ